MVRSRIVCEGRRIDTVSMLEETIQCPPCSLNLIVLPTAVPGLAVEAGVPPVWAQVPGWPDRSQHLHSASLPRSVIQSPIKTLCKFAAAPESWSGGQECQERQAAPRSEALAWSVTHSVGAAALNLG